ncbi:MAG: hypothetical protein LBU47_04400, partial [Christensenellaceae bacterium]|nr:hypothetical protein [Christensenellaceae bacterium]
MFPPLKSGPARFGLLLLGLRAACALLFLVLMLPFLQGSAAQIGPGSAPQAVQPVGGPALAEQAAGSPAEALPTRGYWQGGVYANPFASLAFAPPGGWQAASDAEL